MTLHAGARLVALAALALPLFADPAGAAIVGVDLTLTPTPIINGPIGGISTVPAAPVALHMAFNVPASNGTFTHITAQLANFAVDFPDLSFDESDFSNYVFLLSEGSCSVSLGAARISLPGACLAGPVTTGLPDTAAVPEPASIASFALGLAAIGFAGRRRRAVSRAAAASRS